MPNKELGIADPIYDALRVRSGQSIAPDLGGGSSGAGGIENKIYVWYADGSTVDLFDPTETGLDSAIAAAASSGDTIWLPSIDIPISAAKTLGAGVAMRGISHKAILTFSGFSGTALTLSAGSFIEGFTISMTSNGTTAIGVNAEVADAVINDMDITADGGSTTNIAIGAGVSVIVDEIWLAANGAVSERTVAWSNYTRNGSRVWNRMASLPDANTLVYLAVAADGSAIYLATGAARWAYNLYKCVNPKDPSPTWTLILYNGFDTGIGTITQYFSYSFGNMIMTDTTLSLVGCIGAQLWIMGEYDGTNWTWHAGGNEGGFEPQGAGYHSIIDNNFHLFDEAHALVETLAGSTDMTTIWHRAGAARYLPVNAAFRLYLHIVGSSSIDIGADATGRTYDTHVRGAHQGVQVYCVSNATGADNGALWISENGTTFSKIATWITGWVEDDERTGGGYLIWIAATWASGTPIARQYDRAGTLLDDLTGNFDSIMIDTSQVIVGAGIAYG